MFRLLTTLLISLCCSLGFYGQSSIDVVRHKIPKYWFSNYTDTLSNSHYSNYLDEKIKTIPKGDSFIFFTDAHWKSNVMHSIDIIDYVRKKTGINTVVFGGDALTEDSTAVAGRKQLSRFVGLCKERFDRKFVWVTGNHDSNYKCVSSKWISAKEGYLNDSLLFETAIKPFYDSYNFDSLMISKASMFFDKNIADAVGWIKQHYYYDDQSINTRFIVLESGNLGQMANVLSNKATGLVQWQYEFVENALKSAPSGCNIVFVMHNWAMSVVDSNGWFVGSNKDRRTYQVSNQAKIIGNIAFKYKNKFDKIIVLGGHYHVDYNTFYNGIPYIMSITDCASRMHSISNRIQKVAKGKGKKKTISEQAIDVVTFTDQGIVLTRFGANTDRYINK